MQAYVTCTMYVCMHLRNFRVAMSRAELYQACPPRPSSNASEPSSRSCERASTWAMYALCIVHRASSRSCAHTLDCECFYCSYSFLHSSLWCSSLISLLHSFSLTTSISWHQNSLKTLSTKLLVKCVFLFSSIFIFALLPFHILHFRFDVFAKLSPAISLSFYLTFNLIHIIYLLILKN